MEGNRNNVASSRDIVAIMLARDYPTADIGQSNRLYIEPLPELDYDLIYNLLSLRRAQGYTRELTCCDLLVKSRKLYYKIQRDFQGVFYALQDSYSHSTLLDQENERLKKAGPIKASQLLYNENERQRNSQTLRHYLEKFDHLHNKRETTTKHFSRMKVNFIKYDMPQLIAIGKAAYSQATNCQGPAPSPQTIFSALTPLRSPVEITDNQSTSASSATMFKDNTNLLGILEPDSQDEEQCSYAQVSVLSDLERVMDTVMGIE